MGYRSQGGPRRGSGQRFQKSSHDKAKPKAQKTKSGAKYGEEESALSADQIAEKTLSSLNRLGSQTFALSPFSQYYDDWLVNLRQVVSEFESNPALKTDDAFVKDRTQAFLEIEGELAKNRIRDSQMDVSARELADSNHLLVDSDATYAAQTRNLAAKRNCDIEQLTKNVHELEEEVAKVKQMKTSFFGFTKKAKAKKEEETTQKLTSAKSELEITIQNFQVEQEKLHDEYEKKKNALIEKVQSLEKQIADIETDSSAQARQASSTALANAVKGLLQRQPAPTP
jgi:hypothetical protein